MFIGLSYTLYPSYFLKLLPPPFIVLRLRSVRLRLRVLFALRSVCLREKLLRNREVFILFLV